MHRAALALLALCACENDDGTIVSNGVIAEVAASSVGVWGPTSAAPDTLLVRAVDAAWLSTGPGVVSAVVDGVPVEVEVDPRGYGLLPVAAVGEVALGGLGAERAVVGGPAWASGWGPALAGPGVPTALEAARGGSLAAVGEQIWWVGPSLPAHPVVGFAPGSTPRVRGLPVDDDAAIDAVAFAGERVVLLRGRGGGGAGAGLVLDAAGWEARGADVRDMDGDGSRDLVIAWLTPSGGVLQVWSGDGSWVFEPLYERAIPSDPLDLAVAADRADGLPIATAITADGGWQRLVRTAAGEWRLTGPPLTISGVLGSTVRSGGDYDGSGNDNLVTAQPRVAGQEREAMIWSLDRDPPTFTRTVWAGGHLAYGDLEREGRVHLLGIEEGSRALRYLTWRDGQALNRDLGTVTGFGPIGLGELDGDPIPDLLVADEVWTWFRGLDDGGDDASRWRPERALGPPVGLDLWGPVAASSGGRVVGITRTGDLLRVSRLRFDGLAPVADSHTLIGPVADEVVDLAICGDVAYVLTLDAVIAVRIGGAELGRRALGAPRAIACGAGPGGATVGVVDGEEIVLLNDAAAVLSRAAAPGATHLALGDLGAGPAMAPCAGRCAIWPVQGGAALAVGEPDGLVLSGALGDVTLPGGAARPTVQDVDGDGAPELVWRWGGRFVGIARTVEGALAPPVYRHVEPSLDGDPVVAALAGGEPDLWFRRDLNLFGPPFDPR